MDARSTSDNPLGLNLDFLYGRGYLWAKDEHVSDWVTLRHLRMEIPDLSFPFDVRGGLDRFRNTRCLVRELELEISQVGLDELLRSAAVDLEGFEDVEIRFLDGVALVSARVRAFGASSFLTFRVAALRPEPADSDVIRLTPYDYRAYGPLPCPVRQLGHTFVARLLESEKVASLGAGTSFSIDSEGDVLLVRPLKLVLLHIFTARGWKLPNLARVGVDEIGFRPGAARLRAVADDDETWTGSASDVHGRELSRALAADEARRLFGSGDEQLFAGRAEQALATYQSFQERYRSHPGLVRRLLDLLLADPTPANVAEARSLCDDTLERDPDSLVGAMGRAKLAEVGNDSDAIVEAYEHLSELLDERDDPTDRALCEVVLARHLADEEPDRAAQRLTSVLRAQPRNRPALDALRRIYERTDRRAELEDVLKRLTGVAPDEESLVDTYLELARHLTSQNEPAEARVFLERARRIDPTRFDVLDALGHTWVMDGDGARAIKTLGSAANRAGDRGEYATASRLLFRISRLWNEELQNHEQALLQIRRAIELWERGRANEPLELARQLRYAAQLCEEDRQHSEAIAYWTEALAALQLAEARVTGDERLEVRRSLASTHRDIASAYRARGRGDVAANHERRLVEMDPTDLEAIDALENHYRGQDDLRRFAEILHDAVERLGPNPESLELRARLAELQIKLEETDAAIATLEHALGVAPSSERVRRLLSGLLVETGQPRRLEEILAALRHRVQQRELQWAIAVELGDLHIDVLEDPAEALRAYVDATELLPARREAYTWARFMFERLAAERGWDGESPLEGTLGEDLLSLWTRLAESAPSNQDRAAILDELSDLAVSVGDDDTARRAVKERQELGLEAPGSEVSEAEVEEDPDGLHEDSDWVDDLAASEGTSDFEYVERTRTMKSAVIPANDTNPPWSDTPTALQTQEELDTLEIERAPGNPAEDRPSDLAEESSIGQHVDSSAGESDDEFNDDDEETTPRLVVESDPLLEEAANEEPLDVPDVAADDEQAFGFQRLFSKFGPQTEDEEPPRVDVDAPDEPETRPIEAEPEEEDIDAQEDVQEEDVQEEDVQEEDAQEEDAQEEDVQEEDVQEEDDERVSDFRREFEEVTKRPPPLPNLDDVDEDSSLARVLRRAPTAATPDFEGDRDSEPGPAKDDAETELASFDAALEEARQADDKEAIVDAIEALLDHGEISDTRRAALEFEVGELLYYDLEESDRALDHLLEVRRLDPEGYGARPGVLNAIEAIYEERGSVEGRIEILESRLAQAESRDMKHTYRLLIAQLEWEAHEDAGRVRERLEPVLEDDDRHEGAHRLLADVAEDREDWGNVAEHLRIALSVSGDGLDSVELRRRMANLLLERLDEPERALAQYQQVLDAAPGDSNALIGVRTCHAALGDWDAYIENLAEELRLLLGKTLDNQGGMEWLTAVHPEDVAEPLRTPAAQILGDIADVVCDELDDEDLGWELWGTVIDLWPEHVAGLERRIDLDRKLDHHEALADDLEDYAAMLLDANARFDALYEAARIRTDKLGENERAKELLHRALEVAESLDEPPNEIDGARETLRGLEEHGTKLPG